MRASGSARGATTAVLAMVAPTLLAACGASSPAASASKPSGTSSASQAVATLDVNKTAQVLPAAAAAGSKADEATFVLQALDAAGKPVANAPVTFYVGTMVPLSGHPPVSFISSRSPGAVHYIAAASSVTSAAGQATLKLLGQPSATMEMIGAKVGDLSTFDAKTHKAVGALDAWWTSPSAKGAAPVGAYVTVVPFAARYPKTAAAPSVKVTAMSATGPVSGAAVSVTPKTMATSAMGSSSMGAMSSSSSATQAKTSANGSMAYPVMFGKSGTAGGVAVRIVVNQPSGTRLAGGMMVQLSKA